MNLGPRVVGVGNNYIGDVGLSGDSEHGGNLAKLSESSVYRHRDYSEASKVTELTGCASW